VLPWLGAADAALLEGPDGLASRAAAAHAIRLGVPLVAPDWLNAAHKPTANQHVHTTDGRTRTLLPAMLLALGDPGAAARADQQSPA
jgi:hypothetical protein